MQRRLAGLLLTCAIFSFGCQHELKPTEVVQPVEETTVPSAATTTSRDHAPPPRVPEN